MSNSDKSIPLPKFSGERKDFQAWWTKFRGFAVAKGVSVVLSKKTVELPATEGTILDDSKPDEKRMIEHRKLNAFLMAYLTNAFQKQQDLLLAYKTMNKEWPGGKGYEVIEKMLVKYRPQDVVTDVELHQKLNGIMMSKKENPDNMFEKLAEIKNWYDTEEKTIDTSLIVTKVMGAAPKEYTTTLKQELKDQGIKAGDSTSTVDVDKLQAAMVEHFRMLYGHEESNEKNGQEYTLTVQGSTSTGGKKCFNCNQFGHIAKNCPKKGNSNNNSGNSGGHNSGSNGGNGGPTKFQGKCNECGKTGHKAAQCWRKAGNEHLKPDWLKKKEKSGNEVGAAATDGSRSGRTSEYSLTAIELPIMQDDSQYVLAEYDSTYERVCDGYSPNSFFDTFESNKLIKEEEEDTDDETILWAIDIDDDDLEDIKPAVCEACTMTQCCQEVVCSAVQDCEPEMELEEEEEIQMPVASTWKVPCTYKEPYDPDEMYIGTEATFDPPPKFGPEDFDDLCGYELYLMHLAHSSNPHSIYMLDVIAFNVEARRREKDMDDYYMYDYVDDDDESSDGSWTYTYGTDVTDDISTDSEFSTTETQEEARDNYDWCDEHGYGGYCNNRCFVMRDTAMKQSMGYMWPMPFEICDRMPSGFEEQEHVEVSLSTVDDNGIFGNDLGLLSDPNVWIVDTGASLSSTGHADGMVNLRMGVDSHTTVGNGNRVKPKGTGSIPVNILNKRGIEVGSALMTEVNLMPGSPFNLLSGTWLIQKGYKMLGDESAISFTKGNIEIRCDLKIRTNKGLLYAVYLKRTATSASRVELSQAVVQARTMTINEAHAVFGHHDEKTTRRIASYMGIHVTRGSMIPCESCGLGKAKQKNIAQIEEQQDGRKKATVPNERIYADMSSVRPTGNKTALYPNMWLMIDEYSGMKFVKCFRTKDGMVEPTCELFSKWKVKNRPVQYVRMDNAGENVKLEQRLKSSDWKLHPVIEFTTRDTPQHNHLAEVAIANITRKGRTMMIEAKLPDEMKYLLQHKAMETAAKLDSMVVVEVNGHYKTRCEHWSGEMPKFHGHVRRWGEAGMVKLSNDLTPKLNERGVVCMFIGFCDDHGSDAYEMYNPKTKRFYKTRDVLWLKRMYYGPNNVEVIMEPDVGDIDAENEDDNQALDTGGAIVGGDTAADVDDTEDVNEVEDDVAEATTRPKRTARAPTRLIEEIDALSLMEAFEGTAFEIAAVGAGIGGGFENTAELIPMKYNEAMAGPDREGWIKAVEDEHNRMLHHKVWTPVKRSDVPRGTKIITTTWAMKKKANGTLRARINARGYEQIEGIHYQKKSVAAPTVHSMSINITFILIATGRLCTDLNDVQGAFLNGMFSNGEKIYMEVPQGFEKYYDDDEVLLLTKTIYGLTQSAYEYYMVWLKAVRKIKLNKSKADPCVFFRWTNHGLNLWTSWVDDILSCGQENDLRNGRTELKKYFGIDEQGQLQEYIGCKVEYDQGQGKMYLSQPVLIQSLSDEFELQGGGWPSTPAAPGSILMKGELLLDEVKHRNYRKGVHLEE